MGADPPGCFEAPEKPQMQKVYDLPLTDEAYLVLENLDLKLVPLDEGRCLYQKAEDARKALASRIRFTTPDPYFNTLGGALAVAADGIWDGQVWLHGAVGWRMPLSGWRAAYTGNALGWHDRARKHFDAYAASQVTDVPNTIPHPAQDSALHLARSVKKWGTPQYSNGYICRNPRRNNQMHHYDMNLCYIDELLWHFNWTGDLDYARQMWPVITRHLAVYGCLIKVIGRNIRISWGTSVCMRVRESGLFIMRWTAKRLTRFRLIRQHGISIRRFLIFRLKERD